MTRPICVFSAAIRSNLEIVKAIASFHDFRHPPVASSSYRTYVVGTVCILGMSLFSAVHLPDALAGQPSQLAPAPVDGSVQLLASHSSFNPPDDIGLPERREAGGTR